MTTSANVVGAVRIRASCGHLLREDLDRISVLFSARLTEKAAAAEDEADDGYVAFDVVLACADRKPSADFVTRLQKYVDDVCREGCAGAIAGEDSSYDSDYEADTPGKHQDVSRTTSDTLAAEYAEYVQSAATDSSPGYTARVEFALKLGYTERLVQAALQKLGPSPAQNELLAELIKLGAQRGGGSCDGSPTESPLDVAEISGGGETNAPSSGQQHALRPVVIDGSNVAMSHGNKETFSCRGIKICVDWFRSRGHKDITVFVPKWRKEAPRPDNPICEQEILAELERDRLLVFTPSRLVGGKRTICYDDRYILKLAAEVDGVVVSNDNYRDLCQESADFRKVVEERVLMYSFVNDRFMPPDDPLGRSGPTLENFLRVQPKKGDPPPPCPYAKKCTYGNKCKYHHPERGPLPHKSVTERLSEHAQRHLQARGEGDPARKQPLGRTRSNVPPVKEAQHAVVAKSRSVDNVGCYQQATPPTTQTENLHRKLQRQLTLNPTSDPRLARRFVSPQQQQNPQNPQIGAPGYLNHGVSAAWDQLHHQHVTRIASAPDSYRPWPPSAAHHLHQQQTQQHQQHQQHRHMQRMSSCSDPQLNVWPPPPHWTQGLQEDARRKLHYHLAAIFPEEQVSQAMHLYPEETNPQKICAAILAMFPQK